MTQNAVFDLILVLCKKLVPAVRSHRLRDRWKVPKDRPCWSAIARQQTS